MSGFINKDRPYHESSEKIMGDFLEENFYNCIENCTYERITDKNLQVQGVDVKLTIDGKVFLIDEICSIMWRNLKTFSFELSTYNRNRTEIFVGWFLNDNLLTTHYLLVWVDETDVDEDNSGTMAYMAPERFSENYRPTAESDIWAFGATLYEILTGEVPFKEEGGKNQLEKNMKLKSMGSNIPKEIQKLINSCLSLNPQERPTANQIIKLSEKHLNTSNSIIKYASAVILFALITWGIYSFLSPKPPVISMEESYNKALVMLNSNNPHDVKQAVNIMDSLSIKNYAPAMYELARTYGWYSDSLLLKRKEILGIDYYDDKEHYGLPKLDKYNDKARDLYSKILELNDSTTAIIKANAAYRMATYSANETTGIYGQNFKKAKEYLLDAKKYAMEAKDDSLLMSINNAISIIDKRIK